MPHIGMLNFLYAEICMIITIDLVLSSVRPFVRPSVTLFIVISAPRELKF
jgi:hypothetical protein